MSGTPPKTVYLPQTEWDSCGFGMIAHMDGEAHHRLVETAVLSLGRMLHRGAIAADFKSGDGCGLLMSMPRDFMRAVAGDEGIQLPEQFAVGVAFLSHDDDRADAGRAELEKQLAAAGLKLEGWRRVPIKPEVCGEQALATLPHIEQVFVSDPGSESGSDDGVRFERQLFVARRRTEIAMGERDPGFYIPGLSARLLSYKALVLSDHLAEFYPDLRDPRMATSICLFHQRFSTNTQPEWALAQPMRLLAHNGEINTLRGNRNWTQARTHVLRPEGLPPPAELAPSVSMTGSDSCSLDNMLELMVTGGMDIEHAIRLLMPPAWQNRGNLDPDLRACYEYNSMHLEPWDGPAGVALTDGRKAVCIIDRNGLRPVRYVVTKDRYITLASEIGVHDYAPSDVVSKGRLDSGEMVVIDTETGTLSTSSEVDEKMKSRQPYRRWLDENTTFLSASLPELHEAFTPFEPGLCRRYNKMFGVSREEADQVVRVLGEDASEATGSMGDDAPLPILSTRRRSLFDYFRQQFAQVTNPPIDPLREYVMMSVETCLGPQQDLFHESPEHAERIVLDSPLLSGPEIEAIKTVHGDRARVRTFDLHYDPAAVGLKDALSALADEALAAVKDGARCLILSDYEVVRGKIPMHALLACGAVNRRLLDAGLRCHANIVVETGFVRDSHHCAVLIAFGATAVHPYLSYQILADLRRPDRGAGSDHAKEAAAVEETFEKYRAGLNKGLYKIMSKMGISTISSYRNSQLFEIIGLDDEVTDLCFRHTVNRLGGIGFDELQSEQQAMADDAMNDLKPMGQGGLLKYIHGGEQHAYNPDVVQALRTAAQSGDPEDYARYSELVNSRTPIVLRDLLKLNDACTPIPLDEVEPAEDILRRFDSAGMSLGALSPDAHETLAEAMNRLGGNSNSGEGGEARDRYGTAKRSKIKQIASGRFGVTPEYLVNADVLQIKIAQGAKPGEGGQLPGHKVNAQIAHLRHASEGVSLISPPPHHDIYSIEDLAQLIFDLKQVNPSALVSVKLVSEPGVGTVAVGVAKAYADLITISGYDGGTGASPLTSIKYAGAPWELGLPEAHIALRANKLRDKVRVQVDGGLKTGLDVVKAAALGAESFGFGTAPMIAMGCKYLRICHLNNCATGVATQNTILRQRHFIGKADMVVNYFHFVVNEVRELMARIGVARMEDLIGRPHYLKVREDLSERQKRLDLSPILSGVGPGITVDDPHPHICIAKSNPSFDKAELAHRMEKDMASAIDGKTGGEFEYTINNTNRSIGALISGRIARKHGNRGLEDAPLTVRFTGIAGQSFGAWNINGLNLRLTGDANDYVGKGMGGGEIVIRPHPDEGEVGAPPPLIGNTCLYGATGGELYVAGTAGGRFATRNSGATAVIEGVGAHGCEYMTGGLVVVLGPCGLNFAAGMTGGFAMVFDPENNFSDCYNNALVDIQRIDTEEMQAPRKILKTLLARHCERTDSAVARDILDRFSELLPKFWLVKPQKIELSSLAVNLSSAA